MGRGVGGGQEAKSVNKTSVINSRTFAAASSQSELIFVPQTGSISGINPHLGARDLQKHRKGHITLGGEAVHGKTPALARMSAKSPNTQWKAHRSPAICLSVLSSLFVHIRESSLRDRIWGLGLALLCCSYTTLNGSHLFSHRGWLIRVSCTHIMRCQNNSSG